MDLEYHSQEIIIILNSYFTQLYRQLLTWGNVAKGGNYISCGFILFELFREGFEKMLRQLESS